jgi:hypothetical protein
MDPGDVIPSAGERMVYHVSSSKNPKVRYRVDLTAEGGYGSCSCRDFGIRRWPKIKEGAAMGTRDVCCKHLFKARNFFLNSLLVELSKLE